MKYLIFILFASIFITPVIAQQTGEYSLYMFNGLYHNPAYAGSQEKLDFMAIYRHQWAGIEGAPRTANASIQGAIGKHNLHGLGLTIISDQLGLTRTVSTKGAYAIRIPLKNNLRMAMGLQVGGTYYSQRNQEAIPDEAISQGFYDENFSINTSFFVPNFGAGIYLHSKKFYTGVSVLNLLTHELNNKVKISGSESIARQYNAIFATAGVVIGRDESFIKIKPSFLLKYQKGLQKKIPDIDFTLSALFTDRFWVGATYRWGAGLENNKGTAMVLLFECKVTERFRFGYAFEYAIGTLNGFANYGTHDLMIGYEMNKGNKRIVSPRYINYF